MIVSLIDRILKLLDENPDKSAVIATSLDWASAFDRQDPTLGVLKFIQLGVRPALIPILISYLSDRTMKVKFNGEISELMRLIGGGPQGALIGGIEYLAQSNDNADCVPAENRFKFIDDLSIVQLICLSGLLLDYNFHQHVASDIAVDQQFLPPQNFQTQEHINAIADWTNRKRLLEMLSVAENNRLIPAIDKLDN